MKTCARCGMDYPDSENFCAECGSRLQKAKASAHPEGREDVRDEVRKLAAKLAAMEAKFEERHDRVASSSSESLSKLTGRLKTVERSIYGQPEPARNEDLVEVASSMGELEKRIDELEDSVSEIDVPEGIEARIAALEKQVRRAGKEAMRVAKAKQLPGKDAMAMVEDMNELEGRIDKVERQAAAPRKSEAGTDIERRLGRVEKKLGLVDRGMKSFVSVLKDSELRPGSPDATAQDFAKQGELAELKRAISAENEAMASKLAGLSGLKKDMDKSLAGIEKAAKASISSEAGKAARWMKGAESRFATREQVDGLLAEVDARVRENLKPMESFREKVMVIAGLALEQQEKFKEMKSSVTGLVNRRMEQMEASTSRQLEQLKARMDGMAGSSSAAMDSAKARMEDDLASLGESLSRVEEFENRLNGELEALRESAAHRHDIESLKEAVESCNARVATFKQMLASHAKAIDEVSQTKAQMESQQEQALDEMNSRMSEAVQEIKSQGNSIVADMERKMNESVGAGLKSIDDTKARMDGEMRLVLDTLARSQGFDKAVESELASIKSEMGRLDGRIRAAVADEKGALDGAISAELRKLNKVGKEAEHRLAVLKESWDRAIKEAVRRNADEFEKLRKAYGESLERLAESESGVKSVVDRAVKGVEKRLQEEGRSSASLRKEFESCLKDMKLTNRDSQEKLAMVKEFISNMESRLGADIEGLERRVEKLSKIQQRQELDGLSPSKKRK